MKGDSTAVESMALELPAIDRVKLVERLLESLGLPAPEVDALWADEAEARIHAHENGEAPALNVREVFKKYEQS